MPRTRLSHRLFLVLVGGWSLTLSAQGPSRVTPPVATGSHGLLPRHIVLVVIDTLRNDRFQALLETGKLPAMRQLADAGSGFSTTRASSSWTPTSTASIFTSLHPQQHGVMRGRLAVSGTGAAAHSSARHGLARDLETLPMVMRAAGYHTLGFSDNLHIDRSAGFARGFERFETYPYRGARHLAAAARGARQAASGRTFLYLHFMDPHAPYHRRAAHYKPPVRALSSAQFTGERARYDSEIGFVDAQVQRLAQALQWQRDTLVVVTSDHGEAFGEHGHLGHPNQLYEELLRVPMVWYWPTRIPNANIDAPVSTLDILPTLRAITGQPRSHRDRGRSLVAWLKAPTRRAADRSRLFVAARQSQLAAPAQRKEAVTDGQQKVVWWNHPAHQEVFDLDGDPQEQQPVHTSAIHPLRTAWSRQRKALPRFEPIWIPASTGDADLLKRLHALGYGAHP